MAKIYLVSIKQDLDCRIYIVDIYKTLSAYSIRAVGIFDTAVKSIFSPLPGVTNTI